MIALAVIFLVCCLLFVGGMCIIAAALHAWACHDCWDDESSDRLSDGAAEMLLVDQAGQ